MAPFPRNLIHHAHPAPTTILSSPHLTIRALLSRLTPSLYARDTTYYNTASTTYIAPIVTVLFIFIIFCIAAACLRHARKRSPRPSVYHEQNNYLVENGALVPKPGQGGRYRREQRELSLRRLGPTAPAPVREGGDVVAVPPPAYTPREVGGAPSYEVDAGGSTTAPTGTGAGAGGV